MKKFILGIIILCTTIGSIGALDNPRPQVKNAEKKDISPALRSTPPIQPTPGKTREIPLFPLPKKIIKQTPAQFRPVINYSTKNDVSSALRSIKPIPLNAGTVREIPQFQLPQTSTGNIVLEPFYIDPVLQSWQGRANMPAPISNFDGVDNVNGVLPPDTNGDVGPNHYVQWVNLSFAIWNKSGTLLYGPAAGNTLWTGFGGICETNNDGDPIVLYDQLADRWIMSQFALGFPNNFHQCIAISQTGDPTGAWYRYDFQVSTTKMNDYPKFGIWPDGYYMSVNQFDGSTFDWAGAGVFAFDRTNMLAGNPASYIYFDLYSVNPNYAGLLPSDLDGFSAPPASSPNYFAMFADNAWGWPADSLMIFEFLADWVTPANSTFTGPIVLNTASFDSNMCGYARNCIPQPGGANLDAISDRLMYRLAYRNFGTHESLVLNHTVDADSADHAGIRWYEVRDPGGAPAIYQEGTYAPDTDHRWMGSIAMDAAGDIALGYSVSSSSIYPSIRYTGRLSGDPLGSMPQGETALMAGSGYQTHSSGRWGDYSMMGIDPVDDCTFWYTQEYIATNGSAPWRTRIGSFKFPSCTTGPTGSLEGTVINASTSNPINGAAVNAGASTTYTNVSGFYRFATLPAGNYNVTVSAYGYAQQTVNGVAITDGGTTVQNFSLTPLSTVVVQGTVTDGSGGGWPLYARIDISGYPESPVFTNPATGVYSVNLIEGATYTFTVTAVSSGYNSTIRSVTPPASDSTENFALTADNTCTAPGYSPSYIFYDDFESGYANWTMTGLWNPEAETDACGSLIAPFPSPANGAYYGIDGTCTFDNGATNIGTLTMTTPVSLPASGNVLLNFSSYEQTECGGNCPYDKRFIEISTNSGASWTTLGEGNTEDRWYSKTYDLTTYLSNNILIRFRFDTVDNLNNNYLGWLVDNIGIQNGCSLSSGGLVVGNVYDANTSLALNNATVNNDSGYIATTFATPDDPAVADGAYISFSPSGSRTFTASKTKYSNDIKIVNVVANSTTNQNFNLPAGLLSATPASVTVTIGANQTLNLDITLNNNGSTNADFTIFEVNLPPSAPIVLGPFAEHTRNVPPKYLNALNATTVYESNPPAVPPLAVGDVVQTWPTGLVYAWGIGFNTNANDLWLGNIAAGGGDDLDYRFLTDGTNTGDTIDTSPWVASFAADMTYNPLTGMLWQVNVGGDNCIYEMDTVTMASTGNKICPAFGTSERGLAYDPVTDTYYAGSWNDGIINHFDASGTILDSKNVSLAISGLAYNPSTGHLFVMTNSAAASSDDVYVLDVNNNYNPIGSFNIAGLGDNQQAGLEINCNGSLWAVNQSTQSVIESDSGETGACPWDIPWLSEAPTSGTVLSLGNQLVTLTFNTTGLSLGTYTAHLKIPNNTPYGPITVPVSMTVVPLHTIIATAGSGGSIAPSGAVTVTDGADQDFTITPNLNYFIADVLVDGASVGAVATYTFTNVTADHTINATFKKKGCGCSILAGSPNAHLDLGSIIIFLFILSGLIRRKRKI